MKRLLMVVLLGLGVGLSARVAAAQVSDVPRRMPWEYGVVFQGGVGLTENRNGFDFLMAGAHLGKVLTPQMGHGVLRGDFEYAGELFPYWQSDTPKFQRVLCAGSTASFTCTPPYTVGGTFRGVTVTPIILRWNFTAKKRFVPWVQAAGGLLWTNHKYPAYPQAGAALTYNNFGPNSDASVFNFTPQGGVGFHYFVKPRQTVDFGANGIHISSASLGDRNPGVNASVQFTLGYSWWK